MKKTATAITVGLLLVAGQAVAQNNNASARVGDRLGAQSSESSEFAGVPIVPAIAMALLFIAGVVDATDDDSDSD